MKKNYRHYSWQLIFCGMLACTSIHSNPFDPNISQGNAHFTHLDSFNFVITASDKAHIFWNDFSIGEGETTQIIQPSSDSIVVIQIESNSPSSILGTLKSNGHLYLINPNGVFVGANARIETNALMVSAYPTCACVLLEKTEDILFQGDTLAPIINLGRIKACTNNVTLIGYQIENKGAVDAPEGTVLIAAGTTITLKPDQEVEVLSSVIKMENELTGIDNSGMVAANKVVFCADGNAYSVAIRHAGLINSAGIEGHACEVELTSTNGNQGIFGTISAENEDGTGGTIRIRGENIAFFENSNIDASGETEGGTILIGHGSKGDSAKTTFVDEDVVFSADAIKEGNGGTVVIYSDEMTSFYGTVSVCGGDDWGDGGSVHISSKQALDFKGEIDRAAPHGKTGRLFLEPLEMR